MKHIFDHVDSRRIGLDISSQCNISQRPQAREIPNALGKEVEKTISSRNEKKTQQGGDCGNPGLLILCSSTMETKRSRIMGREVRR